MKKTCLKYNKIKMKRIIILVFSICLVHFANAQSTALDSARDEIYKINQIFDSSEFLGFDLSITYKSDSADITKETDQMEGNYVLNNKNMYYYMGSNIYVETDSFSYNIYTDEKQMLVTKNLLQQNSDVFPLKNFIDSMMYYYSNDYNISLYSIPIDSGEYLKRIRFDKIVNMNNLPNGPAGNPPTAATRLYNYFYINYTYGEELGKWHPTSFEFAYDEEAQSETYDSLGNVLSSTPYMATTKVSMNFTNFSLKLSTTVFDDSQYLYYDRQRKIYEPADAYSGYSLITSGFDNEDEDGEKYNEIPANNHD
jgi:hypothetical protein